ncbi:MAG: DpnI domain-containing protein [Methylococcales bacterium]|nr:DpnI domain-containing protein [Methylococcales bacterium]
MNLQFDINLAKNYKNNSQIARVLTESWVQENIYCPNCGEISLNEYKNNKPVADFYCISCAEDFELKSKNGRFSPRIIDGAYSTMIERINSDKNPNFFFLTYNKTDWSVNDFAIIPKYFFTTDIIEKRKPLSETAKRAGWVGCHINLTNIPDIGKIFLVKNTSVFKRDAVLDSWRKTVFLKNSSKELKSWTLDILNCIDKIKFNEFKLSDVYKFEAELSLKYPDNNHIKDKIRQQLQILRDKEIIDFKSREVYRKL